LPAGVVWSSYLQLNKKKKNKNKIKDFRSLFFFISSRFDALELSLALFVGRDVGTNSNLVDYQAISMMDVRRCLRRTKRAEKPAPLNHEQLHQDSDSTPA
jgi:hypothetical protein